MDARRQLTNKSHSLHDIGNATTNATYLRIWSAVNQNAVAAAVVINDVQFVTNWRWPRRGGGCRPSDRRRRHETKACLPIHCSQKPTRWEEGRPTEAASRAGGIFPRSEAHLCSLLLLVFSFNFNTLRRRRPRQICILKCGAAAATTARSGGRGRRLVGHIIRFIPLCSSASLDYSIPADVATAAAVSQLWLYSGEERIQVGRPDRQTD